MKRKHCLKVNNELLKKKFTNIEKNVRQKENRIKKCLSCQKDFDLCFFTFNYVTE